MPNANTFGNHPLTKVMKLMVIPAISLLEMDLKMLTIANRVLCARGSMSQVRQDQPSMLARAEEIQRQIHDLSSRDTQLWSIVSLVILILTGGFLAVVFPNMLWAQRVFRVQQAYLPQLFFGLICLVVSAQHLLPVATGRAELHPQGADQ